MIILFDGVCNLCNGMVNFILTHDRKQVFKFARLQSEFGQNFLRMHNKNPTNFDSIVLIDGPNYYTKSEAIYIIFRHLPYPYSVVALIDFFPKRLSDFSYDFVAKNRYLFFGKKESCLMPRREWQERFLD